jgi:hypothetical protein
VSFAPAFFLERSYTHCTLANPLSEPLWNLIRPDTRLQIEVSKKTRTFIQLREILYTVSQDMLVLSLTVASHYCNCCIYGSTNSGNEV